MLERPARALRAFIAPVPAWLVGLDLLHRLVQIAAGPFPLFKDSVVYWRIAEGLLSTGSFLAGDPEGFRTPLFPLFLALFQAIFGAWALQAIVVVQNLLGVAVSLLVARLCARVSGGRRAAAVGYGLSALSLGRVQYDQQPMSESLFVFLLTLHLYLFWRAMEGGSTKRVVAAGVTLGLAMLTRPVAALLGLGEVLILIGFPGWLDRRVRARLSALFLLGVAVPAGIWVARNAVLFGHPALFRTVGISEWEHTFRPQGASLALPVGVEAALAPGTDLRSGWEVAYGLWSSGLDSTSAWRWMREKVDEAREAQRSDYLRALARNLPRFWWDAEEAHPFYARTANGAGASWEGQRTILWPAVVGALEPVLRFVYRYPPIGQATFSLMGWLAAVALFRGSSEERALGALALLWFLYFCAVTVLAMYPLYRFRMVLDPIAIAVIAVAAGRFLEGRWGVRTE